MLNAFISSFISIFVLGYLKYYLDKKLDDANNEKKEREEQQYKRKIATAKLNRAEGRLFFWIYRAITLPPSNSELKDAWENYNKAEDELKLIDHEIIADVERR